MPTTTSPMNVWSAPEARRPRHRKPHSLRHTFVSQLLANRESPVYGKEQMGHSSIKITVDAYGHLIPGVSKRRGNRLDDATSRNPDATGRTVALSEQNERSR